MFRLLSGRLMTCLVVPLSLCASARAATEVGGALGEQSTWTKAGSPYLIVENVEVPRGAVLTIEPGVTVKSEQYSLIVSGTLVARGTQEEPILFTSSRAAPRPQDWGAVQFLRSSDPAILDGDGAYRSGTILEHAIIEFSNGILIDASAPLVSHCTLRFNAKKNGGGILIGDGTPTIRECTIVHNCTEGNGGGICSLGGSPILAKNHIAFNCADGEGGGIAADFSAPTITGNTITHNCAGTGGGIATGETVLGQTTCTGRDFSRPTIVGNTVANNYASASGGGIHVEGTPTLTDNLIVNNALGFGIMHQGDRTDEDPWNRCDQTGAGVYVRGTYGGPAVIERNRIVHNQGARWGGGLMLVTVSASIRCNSFVDNEATDGGAISAVVVDFTGAGASLDHGNSIEIYENEIAGNQGGGIEIAGEGRQHLSVHKNNLYGNAPFDFQNHTGRAFPLQDVWLDGREPLALSRKVFDYYDDQRCGRVTIVASEQRHPLAEAARLTSTERAFYAAAPRNVQAGVGLQAEGSKTVSIGVAWEPPEAEGVAGYRVIFDREDHHTNPPFSSRAIHDAGVSPIDVGNALHCRIRGLSPGKRYSVVVTAYNEQGQETGFSEVVTVETPRL